MKARIEKGRIRVSLDEDLARIREAGRARGADPIDIELEVNVALPQIQARLTQAIGSAHVVEPTDRTAEPTNDVSMALSVANFRKLKALGCGLDPDPRTREIVEKMRLEQLAYDEESRAAGRAKRGELAVPYVFKVPPFKHQVLAFNFLHAFNEPALFGDCGVGKSIDFNTPTLTTDGWRPIGSLRVGDLVYARDGHAYPVTAVYPQGVRPLYRITFSDGATILADGEHLWVVQSEAAGDQAWRVRSTDQLRAIGLTYGTGERRARWRIPHVESISNMPQALLQDMPARHIPRTIVSIEEAESAEAVCIAVASPDRTYVIDRFVVTHNTYIVATVADSMVKQGTPLALLVVCPVNLIKHVWLDDVAKFTDLVAVGLREERGRTILAEDFDEKGDPKATDREGITARALLRDARRRDPAAMKKAKLRASKRYAKVLEARFAQPADVYVINPENLRDAVKEKRVLALCKRLVKEGKQIMLAIDESSKLKSRQSRTYLSLKKIRAYCTRCVIMTGTPSPNGIQDLWAQFSVLDGGKTLQPNFIDYRHDTCVEVPLRGVTWQDKAGQTHTATKWHPKPGMAMQVHRTIEPRTIRFRTEDCIDLPPRRFLIRDVDMTAEQADAYQRMEEMLFLELEGAPVTAKIAAAKMIKLREITGGFVIDDAGVEHPFNKDAAKMLELDELLAQSIADRLGDTEPSGKAIVWAQYQWECKTLVARYRNLYGARGLFGGISTKQKDDAITRFKADPASRLLICHPASVGHGLTLTSANHVVYYSLSHNFEEFYQSYRRNNRPGQKRAMTYWFLVCPGTIDEELIDAIRAKKNLSDLVTDGRLAREDILGQREERRAARDTQLDLDWHLPEDLPPAG